MTEPAYMLAATRGRGAQKHIVAGTFKTLCGLYVGQARRDAGG